MAIRQLIREAEGAGGTAEGTVLAGDDRVVYHVVTDTVAETKYTLIGYGVLPTYGDVHPENPLSTCRRVEFDRQGKFYWMVTADYSTKPETSEQRQIAQQESPLDRAVVIRWTAALYSKPIEKDKNGQAIVNSAGDYFDPPPEIEETRWNITAQVNLATVPASILTYPGAINSGSCVLDGITCAAETLRIVGTDISEVRFENGVEFRVVTFQYEYRKEGYELSLLDQGFRYDPGDGTRKKILDGDGDPVSSPALLAGDGTVLDDPSPATAFFLTFDVHTSMSFSGLPGIA